MPAQPDTSRPGSLRTAVAAGVCYLLAAGWIVLRETNLLPGSGTGAACDSCEPVVLLGVPLSLAGLALMVAVLALVLLAERHRTAMAGALAITAALVHGGASVAFSLSQVVGISALCIPCQIANAFSLLVAGSVVTRWFPRLPLARLITAQSVLLGVLAAAAILMSSEIRNTVPAGFDERPAQADADAEPGRLLTAAVAGPESAPLELTAVVELGCGVCERFFRNDYARLRQAAEEHGTFRIRVLLTSTAANRARTDALAPVFFSAALAGADMEESFRILSRGTFRNVEEVFDAFPELVSAEMRTIYNDVRREGHWPGIVDAHIEESRNLQDRHFDGRRGTPCFVMKPVTEDDSRESLAFYGYQIAEPFLEYAAR